MSDAERRAVIMTLTELYSPDDFSTAVYHMPHENHDTEGADFEEYFQFLQSFFILKNEFMGMEPGDLQARLGIIRGNAIQWGYPVTQIEAL